MTFAETLANTQHTSSHFFADVHVAVELPTVGQLPSSAVFSIREALGAPSLEAGTAVGEPARRAAAECRRVCSA